MYALILDDTELNNVLMAEAIRPIEGCVPCCFTEPEGALAFIAQHANEIGVVTSDYEMPGMNGIAFIRAARALSGFAHVPIVMVTSMDQRRLRREALEAGATDFLSKPFDAVEVKARVMNLLALNQARRDQENRAEWLAREVAAAVAKVELREQELVTLLMKAAEHRDTDTGDHVSRVAAYVSIIAEGFGYQSAERKLLSLASTMHDIGKIGISDAVLLKPGPLTPAERSEMERHVENGRKILEGGSSDMVKLAAEIASSHHERWDGTGYPARLAGEAIPLSGRIVAVADVFDALTSDRPYKKAWPAGDAKAYLMAQAGSHFDPRCVEAFLSRWPDVLRILSGLRAEAA